MRVDTLAVLMQFLPILIPLAVIELALMIASLIHILTHRKYRMGNRVIWVIVCILINIIGPILYFTLGRGEEKDGSSENPQPF